MANVKYARSTQANAPVLTGAVGSLVALLDALLVNGFTGYTAPGWTKAFTGTNRASYRMNTTGNTGFYLDVNDAGTGTGGAKEALMCGYEVMTAVGTGSQPFPTAAQSSFGLVCRKSTTADTTARPWYFVGDDSCFYLFIDAGDFTSPNYPWAFAFGDFTSASSTDAWRCMIMGRTQQNTAATTSTDEICCVQAATTPIVNNTVNIGCFAARSFTGVGSAVGFLKITSALALTNTNPAVIGSAYAFMPYPNPTDGSLLMAPVSIVHNQAVRGTLKGFWAPLHFQPLGHGDTFSGTGSLAGKDFMALYCKGNNNTNSNGEIILETSNTWG